MRSIFIRVATCCTASAAAMGSLAIATLAGCASTQSQARSARPFDADGTAEAYVAERTPGQPETIRVHSIQRLASGADESLTATVSVRNVGAAARTVTVSVAWIPRGGSASLPEPVSRETVVLNPQETRLLTFVGGPNARDFKVSLTYPGG